MFNLKPRWSDLDAYNHVNNVTWLEYLQEARVDMLFVALPKRLAARLEQLVDMLGFGISLVLLYYGSAVVSDAWRTNMVAYKTWYVPEWLLFLAIPVSALMLAIEFTLRFLRVQGVVRDSYDVTDRASL